MGPGFSPLDDELALLPGNLSPRLYESLVRLATHIPSFAKASQEFTWFTGAHVHPDTARRRTEAAGAVLVAHETAEAARILREHPAPPCTPDTLIFSVDGAMIPLVHGQWTEVRTLAVGEVQPAKQTADGPVVRTTKLSYFSRRVMMAQFVKTPNRAIIRAGCSFRDCKRLTKPNEGERCLSRCRQAGRTTRDPGPAGATIDRCAQRLPPDGPARACA